MKVTKTTAFIAEDECLYATETEAINSNIIDCINLIDHDCGGSGSGSSSLRDDIVDWFRNHPKAVRYVLANIKHAKKDNE